MNAIEPDIRTIQKTLFQALRDRPLDLVSAEDVKLYEPLHDDDHDPVARLFDTIEMSDIESVQLVAGFRGTGSPAFAAPERRPSSLASRRSSGSPATPSSASISIATSTCTPLSTSATSCSSSRVPSAIG